MLLDAIASAGDSRADVIAAIHNVDVDGILGQFAINENGDVDSGAITVYEGPDWGDVEVITPTVELVKAAGGG